MTWLLFVLLLQVLDVTSGAKFYGKGQSYHIFAGKVQLRHEWQMQLADMCTRALALGTDVVWSFYLSCRLVRVLWHLGH